MISVSTLPFNGSSYITSRRAKSIAKDEVIRMGYSLNDMKMEGAYKIYTYDSFIIRNKQWFDIEWLTDAAIIRLKKNHTKFYFVYFAPKAKNQYGGDVMIFIDAKSAEVLYVYQGK